MKKANRKPLTPKLRAELKALAAMPESEIDTAEMPPVADWSHAVRVDADVVDWFQRQGQGYQTRMNQALREYVERRRKRA